MYLVDKSTHEIKNKNLEGLPTGLWIEIADCFN